MTTIAFLGLGQMGGPMALNLVKAGHAVRAYDLVPAAVQKAREGGCTACATVADAVTFAEESPWPEDGEGWEDIYV